jgi:hypothetical protein
MKPIEKYAVFIPVILVSWPVFFYYYNFFVLRGDEADLNIFATVLWRSGWTLANLEGVGASGSYFVTHIAPLLYIPNALSYVLPLSREAGFALFMAMLHGSLAALGFVLLRPCISPFTGGKRHAVLVLMIGLSVLFGFNAIVVNSLWIGHYEFIIPVLLITLFMTLAGQRRFATSLVFVLLLSAREDAGLHAAIFLFFWIALRVIVQKHPLGAFRFELTLMTIGAVYALICIFYIMPQLAGEDTITSLLYFGHPPFAHLSGRFLASRARDYLVVNTHLYLPLVLITGYALARRKWTYLVGVLAVLPWSVVHFLALHPSTGIMYSYKAFPFLVVFVWPFLADRLDKTGTDTITVPPALPLLFAAVIIIGLPSLGRYSAAALGFDKERPSLLVWPERGLRAGYEDFRTALLADHAELGRAAATPGVARLHPGLFRDGDVLVWYYPDLLKPRRGVDTIIYQTGGRSRPMALNWARANGLDHYYVVRGTTFRLFADRDLTGLNTLGHLLIRSPAPENPAPGQEPAPSG